MVLSINFWPTSGGHIESSGGKTNYFVALCDLEGLPLVSNLLPYFFIDSLSLLLSEDVFVEVDEAAALEDEISWVLDAVFEDE